MITVEVEGIGMRFRFRDYLDLGLRVLGLGFTV